ncbi:MULTISPECIES: DUF1822 family protein [unclassified Microcoleus]|uniref:DUF1822 family protein n=1 Tax=unclassified Microcoleus TaxID=2642155 RepID=UPI002FD1F9CF
MNNTEVDLVLTMPIAPAAHLSAQRLSQQQTDPKKAKQVYLNALAVHAVDFYFQCMEIDTDLTASNIWNPAIQKFMDVADLEVKNLGKLECRPVREGEEFVSIPAEVRSDRIGYVAVEIAQSLAEVKLLGFVKKGDREKVPISKLESIENLLEYLDELQPKYLDELKPVHLIQWLHNVFDIGWEAAEKVFESRQKFQFDFRSSQTLEMSNPANNVTQIKRIKTLELEPGERVNLLLGIMPTNHGNLDILIELCPADNQTELPEDVELIVLDERGKSLVQARANKTDSLLFKLSAEPGEQFSVKIALGDFSQSELFFT